MSLNEEKKFLNMVHLRQNPKSAPDTHGKK